MPSILDLHGEGTVTAAGLWELDSTWRSMQGVISSSILQSECAAIVAGSASVESWALHASGRSRRVDRSEHAHRQPVPRCHASRFGGGEWEGDWERCAASTVPRT